jgi:isoquinoline 1-oxidoreductase beta subunit
MDAYLKVQNDPAAAVVSLESRGDVQAAFAGAAKTYTAEFRSDYAYHAQMEPLNAVVRINDAGDRVEVWEGSQAPDESLKAVAKALGLKHEQVTLNQCYMGGGFGRRSLGDYAAECTLIAREVRRPVKLQGVGRGRRRGRRAARIGAQQRGERDHLRALQRAARAGDDQGRRGAADELP